MQEVKLGEKWEGGVRDLFRVIDVTEIEGKQWVYYLRLKDNTEYSCLKESFVHRFRKIITDDRY